jgi:hypothetical protein
LRTREEEWERRAESRASDVQTRLSDEAQQKEELFQSQLRQRDQQWQVKLEAVRAELQTKTEQILRRELESDAGLRELEARLRKEMQQQDDAAQAMARQRELELVSQLTAQAEARQMAAQQQWETESEKKTRAVVEPLKELLSRAEKERDAAVSHVQGLESKLTEASLFLNGWKNQKQVDEAA